MIEKEKVYLSKNSSLEPNEIDYDIAIDNLETLLIYIKKLKSQYLQERFVSEIEYPIEDEINRAPTQNSSSSVESAYLV